MNLTDMSTNLASSLGISIGTELTQTQITRAITRATGDLSRFIPLQLAVDHPLEQTVTDEEFTSSHDTWVDLANKAITYNTETVKTTDGVTTYTRGTDYLMDYVAGRIKVLSTGSMTNATAFDISYERDEIVVDISSVLTNPTHILAIHAVRDGVPYAAYDFEWHGDYLQIRAKGTKSQSHLPDHEILRIWYNSIHTAPTAGASGTWIRNLDEVLMIGAEGYCLWTLAQKQNHAAVTKQTSADTELGLANVAFDAQGPQLVSATRNADLYLDTGDALINAVNLGELPASRNREYAETKVAMARSYNEEGAGRVGLASQHIANAAGLRESANMYRVEAQSRIDLFYAILRDRAQVATQRQIASVLQWNPA